MKTFFVVSVSLSLLVSLPADLMQADPLMITRAMTASTIAQIYIEEDAVAIELEIGVSDLRGFRNLLPDAIYERLGYEPEPIARRLPRFFREDLTIRPDGGLPVPGRVVDMAARPRVRRDEITGEPLPLVDGEGETVIYARLVYPLDRRPAVLNIAPPRTKVGGAAANIGFVVYHRDLPVNDFRYLGVDETLRLDWDDPWYSVFDNRNLRRQYNSPISAYLYIEPYEVRKEIVLRPKDLQQWVDLGLEGKESITVEEQEEVKRKVVEFLAQRNPVTIDGQPVEGTLDRAHFIYRTLRTSGVIDPPRELDLVSATLGVIFVYPVDGLPQEATMKWELFGPRIQRVPTSATDEAGPLPFFVTPDDPVVRWQNFLKNPTLPGLVEVQTPPRGSGILFTLSALIAGAGLLWLALRHGKAAIRGELPSRKVTLVASALAVVLAVAVPAGVKSSRVSDRDAEAIVAALLKNTYRAFDYRDENRIYDALEKSAAGELLTDIYLETRRSLEIENQGGARAKVKEVEVLSAVHSPLDGELGFVTLATWNVSGSVGHWGHIHQRTNQYEARFTVQAIDGVWKITGLELLQEQRL
ncbi:MAG: hypothetical protein Q8W48_07075 [Candidatus Palauibacterales bacterium]|nr:hypothetical protein [Candidatus Palauibacterales bacterium]